MTQNISLVFFIKFPIPWLISVLKPSLLSWQSSSTKLFCVCLTHLLPFPHLLTCDFRYEQVIAHEIIVSMLSPSLPFQHSALKFSVTTPLSLFTRCCFPYQFSIITYSLLPLPDSVASLSFINTCEITIISSMERERVVRWQTLHRTLEIPDWSCLIQVVFL